MSNVSLESLPLLGHLTRSVAGRLRLRGRVEKLISLRQRAERLQDEWGAFILYPAVYPLTLWRALSGILAWQAVLSGATQIGTLRKGL